MQLPLIQKYEITPGKSVEVVRCDVIPGGFKRLAIEGVYLKSKAKILVLATNSLGTGALALTLSLQQSDKKVIMFLSKKDSISANLSLCEKMGATLDFSGNAESYDSEKLRQEALEKYHSNEYEVLPLGLENEEVRQNIIKIAKEIFSSDIPEEMWVATATGLTIRALQEAFPRTRFHAVLVKGNNPNVGKADVHIPKEKFTEPATIIPPYPSNANYDAKVWAIVMNESRKNHLSDRTVVFNIA